jgi:hypothetical protein
MTTTDPLTGPSGRDDRGPAATEGELLPAAAAPTTQPGRDMTTHGCVDDDGDAMIVGVSA